MTSGPNDQGARPARLVVVVGTGTEVGKTHVGAALATWARERGRHVAARKPAQSFEPGDRRTDADVLGAATGEAPTTVCPPNRWYAVPLAPPMAARRLGEPPVTMDALLAELRWTDGPVDLGIIETAGGVRSPLAEDGDAVTLIRAVTPDLVVLVADAGLGTLHLVRLCVDALAGPTPVVVHLNRFDPDDLLHVENRAWLTATGVAPPTVTITELGAVVLGPDATAG